MNESFLKARLKDFAVRILRLIDALPRGRSGDAIARQLGRSGTSAAANYRAACRARSPADFLAKLAIVEEDLDASQFWVDFVADHKLVAASRLAPLRAELNELLAIIVASIRTARRRKAAPALRTPIQNPKPKIRNAEDAAPCPIIF